MTPQLKLIGKRFGRLEALKRRVIDGRTYLKCLCVCGNTRTVRQDALRSGVTKSCGCLHDSKVKHGHFKNRQPSREYFSWMSMLARVRNPKATGYKNYGGKGVGVSDRWNPRCGGSFLNFLADMGRRPKGTELSRYRDRGDYRPGNVVWESRAAQGRWRRENNKKGI